MGKQRTVHGAYSCDDLGRDATGPLKVTEMEKAAQRISLVPTVSLLPTWWIVTTRRNPTTAFRLRSSASVNQCKFHDTYRHRASRMLPSTRPLARLCNRAPSVVKPTISGCCSAVQRQH